MTSFLQRLLGGKRSRSLDIASLQLHLLVAMADVDDRVHELEHDQLVSFVERASSCEADHERLTTLMHDLIHDPPDVDLVLAELGRHADKTTLGRHMVNELATLAFSDDEIDHREEFLLDLVCDVFGLPPVPLHEARSSEDLDELYSLVHGLAQGDRAA
jgi:uncharacterized tellurite resistance protein B-like protein